MPDNFRAWQSSFLNDTQGLGLTYIEELDLLPKWLGKESLEHVKTIRSVRVSDPWPALYLACVLRQECYTIPKIVENTLFKRLDSFPCLSARDNVKLRAFSDLLMELQAAKDEGYFPGFACLDTPRGMKPIVEKLPPSLQDKWLNAGSWYLKKKNSNIPSFFIFVDFVYAQAKARNDPGLVLSNSSQPYRKNENFPETEWIQVCCNSFLKQMFLQVRAQVQLTQQSVKRDSDPVQYCPVQTGMFTMPKMFNYCMSWRTAELQWVFFVLKNGPVSKKFNINPNVKSTRRAPVALDLQATPIFPCRCLSYFTSYMLWEA